MTDAQIESRFDVIWSGRDYLCVADPPVPVPSPERLVAWVEPTVLPPKPYRRRGTAYEAVRSVLPVTHRELEVRSGCQGPTVQSVLSQLRRDGDLVSTRRENSRRIYSLKAA